MPKIFAFTHLCNLKILLDFQASLRFLLSPDDEDRTHASLEFDQIKLTNQKVQIFPKRDKIINLRFLIGTQATFGSGRNSAKFWRHLAVSGLGSCKALSICIVCDDVWDLKRKWKRPKTLSNHSGQSRK